MRSAKICWLWLQCASAGLDPETIRRQNRHLVNIHYRISELFFCRYPPLSVTSHSADRREAARSKMMRATLASTLLALALAHKAPRSSFLNLPRVTDGPEQLWVNRGPSTDSLVFTWLTASSASSIVSYGLSPNT
jgi:hypothetical protein